MIQPQSPPADMEQLALFLAEFPDPAFIANQEHRLVYLNRAAEHLLGRRLGPENQLRVDELFHLEIEGRRDCVMALCFQEKKLNQTPVRVLSAAGSWLEASISACLFYDVAGRPTGCWAILRELESELVSHPDINLYLAMLSSILHNFPTPFFMVNPDLTISFMNEHMERLTGYSREEALKGLTCGNILCTSKCHTNECLLKNVMETGLPISGIRQTIKDRQGNEIPVVVNASVLTDHNQQIIGGFEFIRDISAAVEAEQKINLVTELTQEGILMVDDQFRVVFANSKMAEISGIPKEELLGMDVAALIPVYYFQVIREMVTKVEQGRRLCFCGIIEPPTSDAGDFRDFETCIAVSTIGKHVITCLYFHDLTKRNEYEKELNKAKTFLENIIRSSVDGIVVVDTAGKVLYFNEGAENILGYKAEEVVGSPEVFFEFYDPALAKEIMRRMRSDEYGPPGKLRTTPINFRSKTGEEIPVMFSAAIIKEGEQEIASVGIFSDRREHLRIRKELEEARIQLMQSEKIASLGRLAAAVAHEINNPLAGILIYTEILLKDLETNPQWKSDLEEIIHQIMRCKEIVTRLLEFSRQSPGEMTTFFLNYVLDRSIKLLGQQTLFHDIDFNLNLEPKLPPLLGDPSQMQQVFTNIIINAAHAMHGKGQLTITSGYREDKSEVFISFADTGPGIPPDILDKIFDPFFTTKAHGEGTGLGLSVVYGIVQRHEGRIEVKNRSGGGAEFIITFPLEVYPEYEDSIYALNV
jgi:PAS domain S-box-containing protein